MKQINVDMQKELDADFFETYKKLDLAEKNRDAHGINEAILNHMDKKTDKDPSSKTAS